MPVLLFFDPLSYMYVPLFVLFLCLVYSNLSGCFSSNDLSPWVPKVLGG